MADLLQLLQKYKYDSGKVTEGVWREIALGDESIEIKVARNTSKAYKDRVLSEIIPLLGKAERGDEPAEDVIGATWARVMAGTILTDWRGLEVDGEAVPFSEEAAVMLLTELPEFRDKVLEMARERDQYIEDNLEAVAERLGKTLSGPSSTEASQENQESEPE